MNDVRQATPEETVLIRRFSRAIGWFLLAEWDKLTPEEKTSRMAPTVLAALAHSLAMVVGSLAKPNTSTADWEAVLAEAVEMVQTTARERRQIMLHVEAGLAPALVPEPKTVM